jgi:DNA-binding transcriptional regulator YhcF (GntR family)
MSVAAVDDKPLTGARERFERIYGTIRDRICLLEYEPGTRLAEEDLAREFGVSRTPIRRVLSRLESEGLVESRHGVGTFVTDVDIDNLAQVFQLRMELALRQASGGSRSQGLCAHQYGFFSGARCHDRQPAAQGNKRAPLLSHDPHLAEIGSAS